ncbi:hypothetical protein HK101_001965 [Irineochytrium annulatum]|nr:hypothetical protein HK101_001965 [Irineochytrium annulatum]
MQSPLQTPPLTPTLLATKPGDSPASSSSASSTACSNSTPSPRDHIPLPALSLKDGLPANYSLVDIRGQTENSNTEDQMANVVRERMGEKNVVFDGTSRRFMDESSSAAPTAASTSPAEMLRSIPTLVLYDDRGLDLFDQITYLDEYYLTNAEINVFEDWAKEIIGTCVSDGGIVVELGVGSMRKTKYLLEAIVAQNIKVTYYALDLSEQSLVDSLIPLAAAFPSIRVVGLLGTYDDSLAYVAQNVPTHTLAGDRISRTILWLGSSIGNLTRREAADFLRKIKDEVMEHGDTFLCGIDRRNDPKTVKLAYDDPKGVTREFIMNGLDHVNRILAGNGSSDNTAAPKVFDRDRFEYVSIYNRVLGRHEAYYRSLERQTLDLGAGKVVELEKGELINIEYSVKYSPREVAELVDQAGLHTPGKWTDRSGRYDVHVFVKAPFALSFYGEDGKKEEFKGVPSLAEFEEMWKAWDVITTQMIPPTSLLEKPISLRHPYIFYLGHIPAFTDIQLSRALSEPLTTPCNFAEIFERGIDPDIDDTSVCNPHSRVPDTWPELSSILAYRDACRDRLRRTLAARPGMKDPSVTLDRVLWMSYEHDAMHFETLLYMLLQSSTSLPPTGFPAPPGLMTGTPKPLPTATLIDIPAGDFTLGHDDPEGVQHPADHVYGWDNERPARVVNVKGEGRRIQSRPVTVGEYAAFLDTAPEADRAALTPASWVFIDGAHQVRTVFGPAPLSACINWPVSVSMCQAERYSAHVGAKGLPTEAEMSLMRARGTLAAETEEKGEVERWGVRGWTPRACEEVEGVGSAGAWEWTGSVWERHEGFEASALYPGYSADFFDGKHNVVLGGSWATPPRIATRKTFRNWYQRGYPYVFATFRLVF